MRGWERERGGEGELAGAGVVMGAWVQGKESEFGRPSRGPPKSRPSAQAALDARPQACLEASSVTSEGTIGSRVVGTGGRGRGGDRRRRGFIQTRWIMGARRVQLGRPPHARWAGGRRQPRPPQGPGQHGKPWEGGAGGGARARGRQGTRPSVGPPRGGRSS